MQDSKDGEDLKSMPIEELMAHEKGILNLFEHALQGSPNRKSQLGVPLAQTIS
jgi:hypothetical protein